MDDGKSSKNDLFFPKSITLKSFIFAIENIDGSSGKYLESILIILYD